MRSTWTGTRVWKLRIVTVAVILLGLAVAASAQTFTSLAEFNGTNGSNPFYDPMVQARDGNLYGTTQSGGTNFTGSVFRVTPSGTITPLYSFCSQTDCTDGAYPIGGLMLGTDGNLYGTTAEGGTSDSGTVFRMSTSGALTTLHSFVSTEAAFPEGAPLQLPNGDLLGTSFEGGAANGGSIWQMTPSGVVTVLYSFCSQSRCSDGADPVGSLMRASDNNFYGVTPFGGNNNLGVLYRISSAGVFSKLHDFSGSDGAQPWGTLLQSGAALYGTTAAGGSSTNCVGGCGTIFKFTTTGVSVLHSFDLTDGESPVAGLTLGTDGNLYGTTLLGGASGDGTVFQSTFAGAVTSLHSFSGTDGNQPFGTLVQYTSGPFYGTTDGGGMTSCAPIGCGTIFTESMSLKPFVKTVPSSGPVKSAVVILGSSLTGATSVSFNGTAAKFTVVSSTQINTSVPTGATSGKVKVVTPGGTLISNTSFTVTK